MHFFGYAICGDALDLARVMAPFDETDERFHVVRIAENDDDILNEYETYREEFVVSPDGESKFKWESPYYRKNAELPDGYELKCMPLKEHYGSFDRFVEEWFGYEWDEELEAHVMGGNPNGKYDYWRIAGRWPGRIRSDSGERVAKSWEVESWERDHPDESVYRDGFVDVAPIDAVDFAESGCPTFCVTPDGVWHDGAEWGLYDLFGNPAPQNSDAFYEFIASKWLGSGCNLYAIDIHD